jgi:hypothetical protein
MVIKFYEKPLIQVLINKFELSEFEFIEWNQNFGFDFIFENYTQFWFSYH